MNNGSFGPRVPLFIDDVSKQIVFNTDLYENYTHLDNAFWIPALGYSNKIFDGHIYISGATGSGKSYILKKMILNDRKERKCILFTDLNDKDPTLEEIPYYKLDLTVESGTDLGKGIIAVDWDWVSENDHNKIMLFDDVQFNKQILNYRDQMIEKGRHMNTIVICVNHRLQDYQKTKVPLNESRYIVTFPCSNKGNVKRYLKYELGMMDEDMETVLNTAIHEGRHLIIHKFFPVCIATTESIYKL